MKSLTESRMPHWQSISAANCADALNACEESLPTLAIIGQMLPDGNDMKLTAQVEFNLAVRQVDPTTTWNAIKNQGAEVERVFLKSGRIQCFDYNQKADQIKGRARGTCSLAHPRNHSWSAHRDWNFLRRKLSDRTLAI